MTISVYIPTTPNHLKFLDKILNSYLYKSTVLPDQIVVSISDFSKINSMTYNNLKMKYKDVLFLEHLEVQLAGPNRQFAEQFCTSDIILYQDSDDLPHIQRVEIIKYFFEKYDIIHLHHSYFNLTNYIDLITEIESFNYNENIIDIDSIKFITSDQFYEKLYPNKNLIDCRNPHIINEIFKELKPHYGALAIKKEVLNEIKWKDRKNLFYSPRWNDFTYKGAEDYEFMVEVIFKYNKTIIIDSKIYFYLG